MMKYRVRCWAKNHGPKEDISVEATSNVEAKTLAVKRYRKKHGLAPQIAVQSTITTIGNVAEKPSQLLTTFAMLASLQRAAMDDQIQQLPEIEKLRTVMALVEPGDILRITFREDEETLHLGLSRLVLLLCEEVVELVDEKIFGRICRAIVERNWSPLTDRTVDIRPVMPRFRTKEFERLFLFVESIELLRPQVP